MKSYVEKVQSLNVPLNAPPKKLNQTTSTNNCEATGRDHQCDNGNDIQNMDEGNQDKHRYDDDDDDEFWNVAMLDESTDGYSTNDTD